MARRLTLFPRTWMRHTGLWTVGCVLGAVGLVVQLFWLRFDAWAENDALRPVYAAACAVLPCTVAPRDSVADLSVRNVSLRTRPDAPGTVVVEAVLVNEGAAGRPLPRLALRLSNLAGEVVAARRLEPIDYLATGPRATLAAGGSARVAVEVRSPGIEAVNVVLVPQL